jgi:hypothetical protein
MQKCPIDSILEHGAKQETAILVAAGASNSTGANVA